MSELTSSTEVDGACSILSADATSISPADNTAIQDLANPEQTEYGHNSITRDYVIVSVPLTAGSDEIRLETNQPSLIASYLGQYAEYIPSLQSMLPAWLFQATENEGATSKSQKTTGDTQSFESWVNETITGDYTSSIEDELRFRSCLVRAISENFERLHRIESSLLTDNCMLTNEEICYARASEPQCARRLLLMLLQRDTHTMLMFIHGLRTRHQDAVESIMTALHCHLNDLNFSYQRKCVRCILRERVNISLITDHLLQCSSSLLSFVNLMSEEDQPGKPSTSERLWDELFKVNNSSLYQEAIRIIARAIESCGYHTDITRMLQEEINMNRNSFVCRCEDCTLDEAMLRQSNETNHSATLEVIVHEVDDSSPTNISVEVIRESANQLQTDNKSENTAGKVVKYPDKIDNDNSSCTEDTRIENKSKGMSDVGDSKTKNTEHCSGNEDETQKKKAPDLSVFQVTAKQTSLKRSKRKEGPIGNETKEKRRRNEVDEFKDGHPSNFGNCDLQIEMMKIAIVGQENQPDSGLSVLSLPSMSSYGDSGVYDQLTILSGGSNDETVPKQIVSIQNINSDPKTSNSNNNTGNVAAQEEKDDAADDIGNTNLLSDLPGLEHGELDSNQDTSDV